VRRREFIGLVAGSAVAWSLGARAQQSAMPVIGLLDFESQQSARESIFGFQQGLAETGYVEGKNLVVDYRWADGHTDRRAEPCG